jgi:hypothetical protein
MLYVALVAKQILISIIFLTTQKLLLVLLFPYLLSLSFIGVLGKHINYLGDAAIEISNLNRLLLFLKEIYIYSVQTLKLITNF